MEDSGLDASRHALHEHHEVDELLDDLSSQDKKQDGWIATAKQLSFKVRHLCERLEGVYQRLQIQDQVIIATQSCTIRAIEMGRRYLAA